MKDIQAKETVICFAAPTVYPYFMGKGLGGAELQVMQLSEMFVSAGYRVMILTNEYGQPEREIKDGIEILKVPLRFLGGSNWFLFSDGIRFVWRLIHLSPDFCFVKNPNVVLFFVALASKINHKIKPVKIFALDHDSILKGLSFSMILYRFAIKWTNLYIFQTKKQQEQTKTLLSKTGPVIRNIFIPPKELNNNSTDSKDIDILWVGDFHPNKCPERLYEVAKALPQYQFGMIAKSIPDEYRELHKNILELKNVQFFGRVPFRETQNYFERSKVFLCTSAVEGFPNCFLQAWWSRLPVVSLTFTCDGLLEDKGIGLVSGTTQRICKDLQYLLENKDSRERIGIRGHQYLKDNHLPKSIIEQYQDFMKHNSICFNSE